MVALLFFIALITGAFAICGYLTTSDVTFPIAYPVAMDICMYSDSTKSWKYSCIADVTTKYTYTGNNNCVGVPSTEVINEYSVSNIQCGSGNECDIAHTDINLYDKTGTSETYTCTELFANPNSKPFVTGYLPLVINECSYNDAIGYSQYSCTDTPSPTTAVEYFVGEPSCDKTAHTLYNFNDESCQASGDKLFFRTNVIATVCRMEPTQSPVTSIPTVAPTTAPPTTANPTPVGGVCGYLSTSDVTSPSLYPVAMDTCMYKDQSQSWKYTCAGDVTYKHTYDGNNDCSGTATSETISPSYVQCGVGSDCDIAYVEYNVYDKTGTSDTYTCSDLFSNPDAGPFIQKMLPLVLNECYTYSVSSPSYTMYSCTDTPTSSVAMEYFVGGSSCDKTAQTQYSFYDRSCSTSGDTITFRQGITVQKCRPEPTGSPTADPTLAPVTTAPTTKTPTAVPTTRTPTAAPVTVAPTTSAPTAAPVTVAPTTKAPTAAPTTSAPTATPTTSAPTATPTTKAPTSAPTTATPSVAPVTMAPVQSTTDGEHSIVDTVVLLSIGSRFVCFAGIWMVFFVLLCI